MATVAVPGSPLRASQTIRDSQPTQSALKRTHSDSTDHDDALQSSSKRPKVAFNPDLRIHLFHDYEKSEDLVREEVKRAIRGHAASQRDAYDAIKQLFILKPGEDEAPRTSLLRKYVSALTGYAGGLGKTSSDLVAAILDCRWLGRDEDFVRSYTRLLGAIVSAHVGYASLVFKELVDNFVSCRTTLCFSFIPVLTTPQYTPQLVGYQCTITSLDQSFSSVFTGLWTT